MMKFTRILNRCRQNEDGAVTVDWVVITAIVVGLAFPVIAMVKGGQDVLAGKINSSLLSKEPD